MHRRWTLCLLLAATAVVGQVLWGGLSLSLSISGSTTSSSDQEYLYAHVPQFFLDYVAFHKKHTLAPTAKTQYLIWRCGKEGCGGTGDRIKGIISSFYLALCSHRVFLIDWPGLSHYLGPSSIDWQLPFNDTLHFPTIGKFKRMHSYASPVLRTLQVPPHLASQSVLTIMTNRWYQGEMADQHWYGGNLNQNLNKNRDKSWYANHSQCLQNFWSQEHQHNPAADHPNFLFRAAFHLLFRFSDSVVHFANHIQFAANLPAQYIGVHIRTGGEQSLLFPHDPVRHSSHQDYQKFYVCARQMRRKLDCPIYVASDGENAKQFLLSLEAQETKTPNLRILPNLTLYHMDQRHPTSAAIQAQGELTVWAELLLLIQATCLVTSTSGFSQLASWLQNPARDCAIHFQDCQSSSETLNAALEQVQYGNQG